MFGEIVSMCLFFDRSVVFMRKKNQNNLKGFRYGGNDLTSRKIFLNMNIHDKISGFDSALVPVDAHHRIVKNYSSPLLLGPERSESLLELVMHMFSAREAEIVQYLQPLRPRTVAKVAEKAGRPFEEVREILDNLSLRKKVILSYGEPRKFTILPIVPGTFEMALMTPDPADRIGWHRRFAEIFEKIWDEGYIIKYTKRINSNIRYLPVNGVSGSLYMAWPTDRLEEMLEPYDDFAVGLCQCRMAMEFTGNGCGKPLEACVTMGPSAVNMIQRGLMRRSDRSEIIEIKHNAEDHGCVSWMMNDPGGLHRGNSSCSCCGCCCHFMRGITQFNAPGFVSRPHFLPSLDNEVCIKCGKCFQACPMDAWEMVNGLPVFDPVRCIGCGLCVLACPVGAMSLKPVNTGDDHTPGWFTYFMDIVPGYIVNSFSIWLKRFIGSA